MTMVSKMDPDKINNEPVLDNFQQKLEKIERRYWDNNLVQRFASWCDSSDKIKDMIIQYPKQDWADQGWLKAKFCDYVESKLPDLNEADRRVMNEFWDKVIVVFKG